MLVFGERPVGHPYLGAAIGSTLDTRRAWINLTSRAEATNEARTLQKSYFTTFPERMQLVQASRVLGVPFTVALTRLRFGFQRRLVTLWA